MFVSNNEEKLSFLEKMKCDKCEGVLLEIHSQVWAVVNPQASNF